jgi:peroxiredoxin
MGQVAGGLLPGDRFPELDLESSGSSVRLSERWAARPLIVSFMRHFGCAFCREQLILLSRAWGEIQAAGGDAVAVFQHDPDATERFCEAREVPFSCLGDPALQGWDRLALGRGNWRETIALRHANRFVRAIARGGAPGKSVGDVHLRPGAFVVGMDGRVVYAHYASDASDNPPVSELLAALRSVAPSSA